MVLRVQDKRTIQRILRRNVGETLAGLRSTVATSNWITPTNRYSRDPVSVIKIEVDSGVAHHSPELSQYIAASPLLHTTDGWSYLGKALIALLRGDPHRAIHFAYYAELRAAIALLATEGIGVFSTNHFAITQRNTVRKLNSPHGTHRFAWSCLEYWATLPAATGLIVKMIRPQGIALEDWFASVGGTTAIAPQAEAWLQQWGVDLRDFSNDRDARNFSSYQPDGIPVSWGINARDALEFARDLWESLEPSSFSPFDTLDRNILRIAVESLFTSRTGSLPRDDTQAFEIFASGIVQAQGLAQPTEVELLRFLKRANLPHDAIVFTNAKKPASDFANGAHSVVSRAALLLRLASGASTMLLRSAGFSASDIEFWLNALSMGRGLAEAPLSNPMDMWADVADSLSEVEAFQQDYSAVDQTFFKLRSQLGGAIVSLGTPERVAIWAMTP